MSYILSNSEQQNQIKELKDVFIRFDESGDGHLQLEEIQKGLKEVLGHVKGSMKIYEEIMQSLDKNCNGVIDYSEFLVAAADKEQLLNKSNLMLAFQLMDADGNGSISRQELRNVFETSEKKDEQLWNEIFNEVDADGDGAITFDEFRATMDQIVQKRSSAKYLVGQSDIPDRMRQANDQRVKEMFADPQ
jgi:calcium-dependent protein kinase